MKKERLIACSVLFVTIASFFAPYILVNNNVYSLIEIIKNTSLLPVYLCNFLPFLFLIISSLIDCMFVSNAKKNPVLFLINVIATVLFVFSKRFVLIANPQLKDLKLYLSPIIMSLIGFTCSIYYGSKTLDDNKLMIKDIVEIAIFVSFAIVLDLPFFKIRIGANGGSISLVMIPLCIIALRKGTIKGFIAAGFVYGILNCLLDGYGIVYYPFDYLLGFGSIALLGIVRNFILKSDPSFRNYLWLFFGMSIVFIGRTLSSTVSGIVYYKLTFLESLVYQLAYIGPSCGLCFVVLSLLIKPFRRVNNRFIN